MTDPLLISQVANLYGLRIDLLTAQIQVESSDDPNAFRYEQAYFDRYIKDHPTALGFKYGPLAACSYGLLQILLETAIEMGYDQRPEMLFDARVGLSWGAKYLKRCLNAESGSYPAALRRYNGSGKQAQDYAAHVFQVAGMDLSKGATA